MKLRSHAIVIAAVLLVIGGRLVIGQHAHVATNHVRAMDHAMVMSGLTVRCGLPTEATAAEPTAAAMKKLGKSFEYHIWSQTTSEFVAFGVPGNNTNANQASWPIAITFLKAHTM